MKQRLSFASLTAKERLNFPVASPYDIDIITKANLFTGKLNAEEWQILDAVFNF
ncbi:MAG: hypothetical protein PHG00_17730 [Methylococcales bacterium]|nr:hypothetical protein [Methylococcales bacterium]